MDHIAKGEATEKRALSALNALKMRYPELIRNVRQSPPEMDARGIDCLVRITLPEGSLKESMTVPVEFKSSWFGVSKWKVKHPDLHRDGVLIFAIPRSLSDRKLRRLFYRALTRVQKNSRNGTLYHSMFQRLFRGGSKNLRRIVDLIKERRTNRPQS